MTAPAPVGVDITPALIEKFRKAVGADGREADIPDDELTEDLTNAKITVDHFAVGTEGIPNEKYTAWYLRVGTEIFEARRGPVQFTDRFGNDQTGRSTRNPLQVVVKEMKDWVVSW
jgi:hypothetical protein